MTQAISRQHPATSASTWSLPLRSLHPLRGQITCCMLRPVPSVQSQCAVRARTPRVCLEECFVEGKGEGGGGGQGSYCLMKRVIYLRVAFSRTGRQQMRATA